MFKKEWVLVLGVALTIAFIGMGASAYKYFGNDEVTPPSIISDASKKQFTADDKSGVLYAPTKSTADSLPEATTPNTTTPSPSGVPKPNNSSGISPEDQAAMDRIEKNLTDQAAALAEAQRAKQCELIAESYPVYVNQENSIYQGNINSITSYYVGRGMGYSGAYQAAKDAESARHIQKLGQLESDHNAQIVQYGC